MATLERCVKPVFEAMSLEERGLLHLLLVHGKELEAQLKALGADLNDPKVLNGYGERETVAGVVDKLQSAFESGSGLLDALAGRFDNYGAQLDYVINKVLAKALKVARPLFDEDPESLPGALLREQWITEKLLEALWDRLPEEAKREIAKKTEELLKRAGVDPASAGRAAGGLLTGGFSAARLVLGFRFHILLAQLANLLIPSLSLATNAALQRFAGLLFGPWGWILSIVLLVPTLIGWIFPRELDKYISAVFVMGVRRLQAEVPAMS